MHLHFEKNINTKCDCSILSLSWMGKVPDDIPEDDGWKLNRTNYYQEGWLATGNIRGIVGVTFTTSHCKKIMDYPLRTNYNLRGHRSDVMLVKWNEPYQKLASCDSSGIIFVWIKYEGRWSIELINDRNTPVTYFSWSHDGRMALICYQDGFVLVGSVAGQRYWSSMLNLESTITCGIWTPDDQQVYFGTNQGQVIVMDVHGAMVSQVQLCSDIGIASMAWSCEKFKMEEGEEMEPGVCNASKRTFVLAVSFQNGNIYLLKSFDDVSPIHIDTDMNGSLGFVMEWSNSRELLAVAGTLKQSSNLIDNQGSPVFLNILKFYTESGILLYSTRIPSTSSAVSALTWGHNDKRLFIATGTQVHIAWVSRRIASLQLLCRLEVQSCIGSDLLVPKLPLPSRLKLLIGTLFAQTIRCCVPNSKLLREFVSRPPICSTRLHCTMIRHDDDNNVGSGTCYTLYLEYLGGLVPLLKGKRTSKIRPEFVIFDPQATSNDVLFQYPQSSLNTSACKAPHTDSSDSDTEQASNDSPTLTGGPKIHNRNRNSSNDRSDQNTETSENTDELAYVDTLPEEVKLVEVTSNIWGTKFKIHGLAKTVPANLGQVTYKTSLLHLQPRQMTLVITELRDDFPMGPDPNFNPNIFSEDEEETLTVHSSGSSSSTAQRRHNDGATAGALPIAPMSPRPGHFSARMKNGAYGKSLEKRHGSGSLAKDEDHVDGTECHKPKPSRPKNIPSSPRQGPSYSTLVTQYSRSSSSSSGQSRHAISPLCCEGSVPTLQSPKSAVGPSDTIFERPPAMQSSMMSYSGNSDYTGNGVQVKNLLLADYSRLNNHVNLSPSNFNSNVDRFETKHPKDRFLLKKKDEENAIGSTTVTIAEVDVSKAPSVVPIAPMRLNDSITRSCSVGYLDSVEIVPSEIALSMLRKDTPNKRLILVDRKPNRNKSKRVTEGRKKVKLEKCGKSRSLDSCDLSQMPIRNNNDEAQNVMPKLNEAAENEGSTASVKINSVKSQQTTAKPSKSNNCSACNLNHSEDSICSICNDIQENNNNISQDNKNRSISMDKEVAKTKLKTSPKSVLDQLITDASKASCSRSMKNGLDDRRSSIKKSEVITSYTDSPLFTRKHRFGEASSTSRYSDNRSPLLSRKLENGFNLIKQFSESRKWRKEENTQNSRTNSNLDVNKAEMNHPEQRTSIPLHTQAITTLENIISRLRDLDDDRITPPGSPQDRRHPRSTPASPAVRKKSSRNQSSSPIRHLLNSPLLNRRQKKKQSIESSDDESSSGLQNSEENVRKHYRNLETFQKAQLRQKLKRGKIEPNGTPTIIQPAPLRREFVMHNKAPMWNENSQVYQLDFGGRVTQESAKNFQIEFRGKQVMQFGRIDGNAYTLDFQYPFSALQAFAVALANVTQRLK